MPARFMEVVPNLLYRGGAPKRHEIPILKNTFGIQQIISLDQESGEHIDDECKKNNIHHIMLPLSAHDLHDKHILAIQNGVTQIIGDKISYVHCHHGKDRTGLFIAKYRVENGMSCKEALDEAIKFGFGIGVPDEVISLFIHIISASCKKEHDHANIEYFFKKIKSIKLCDDCGMAKTAICPSCIVTDALVKNAAIISKDVDPDHPDKGKNILDLQREQQDGDGKSDGQKIMNDDDPEIGGGSVPSTLFHTANKIKMNRKQRVNILRKMAQQISFKIPEAEKVAAKHCIKILDELVENVLFKVKIHDDVVELLDIMYNPFNENMGITTEQSEKIKPLVKIFSELIEKNMTQIKKYIVNALDILSMFESDADVAAMNKSLFESAGTLNDEVEMFIDALDNTSNKDFQQDVVNSIKTLKKSAAQLKQLINERIISYLRKDVLGEDWSTEIKQEIEKEKVEQKPQTNRAT